MNDQVVIIGASGFGRETLDTLEAMIAAGAPYQVAGVFDDGPSQQNIHRLNARNIPYLGTIDDWIASGVSQRYVLAIGAPSIRRRLVEKLDRLGARALTVVHPSAVLGSRAALGEGVVVCAGALISTNVHVGRHSHINPGAIIGHDAILGDFVSINPGATVSGEVHICQGTLVGAASTILQGLSIGPRVTIGAGAVLTRSAPADVVVKGIPGRWGAE